MPAIFQLDDTSQALTLRKGIESAPWLHFIPAHLQKSLSSGVQLKKSNGHVLSSSDPWWYCRQCHKYWLDGGLTRVPMRNFQEGYYTVWSRGFGYPHLYPALQKMYPHHAQMPSPAAVLECQKKRKQRGELLRADYKRNPLQAARRQGSGQSAADKLVQEIMDLE